MGWTDDLQGCVVQDNGTTVAQRQTLNFHGFDIADDQANGRVDIYSTSGSDWKGSVRLCPAAALPAYTRTLSSIEANANAALPSLDGVAAASGDLVLLVGAATASDVDNGIWRITSLGAAGSKWSMARAQEADESVEITPQMVVRVEEGTTNGNREFVCTNTGTIAVNTTPITFVADDPVSHEQAAGIFRPIGADPTGAVDCTAAVVAAVALAAVAGGRVVFGPGTFLLSSTVQVSDSNVRIEGAGGLATIIKFQPAADDVCFEFSDGANSLWACGIRGLTFRSTDTTFAKTMIKLVDVRGFLAEDLWANDDTWTGKQSIGLDIYGREEIRVRDCQHLAADIPVRINEDPNLALFSLDHSSVEGSQFNANIPAALVVGPLNNLVWDAAAHSCTRVDGLSWIAAGLYKHASLDVSGSDLNNGRRTISDISAAVLTFIGDDIVTDADDDSVTFTLAGNSSICIDHNAILTNCAFRDNAMCLGTSALHFRTGLAVAHSSYEIEIRNCRFEQGRGGDSYCIDVGGAAVQLRGLHITECYSDTWCNGVRLAAVVGATIEHYLCDKASPGVAFAFNSTCSMITRIGCISYAPTAIVGADVVDGYHEINCVVASGSSHSGSVERTADGRAVHGRTIIGGATGWNVSGAVADRIYDCEFRDQTTNSVQSQNGGSLVLDNCTLFATLDDHSGETMVAVNTASYLMLRGCALSSDVGGAHTSTAIVCWDSVMDLDGVSIDAPTAEAGSLGIVVGGASTVRLGNIHIALENHATSYGLNLDGVNATIWRSGRLTLTGPPAANMIVFSSGASQAQCNWGWGTLAAGTVTIPCVWARSGMHVELTPSTPGGAPGALRVGAIVDGVSFDVTSTSATDTSVFRWFITAVE